MRSVKSSLRPKMTPSQRLDNESFNRFFLFKILKWAIGGAVGATIFIVIPLLIYRAGYQQAQREALQAGAATYEKDFNGNMVVVWVKHE
jgi:hypothetical protein